MALSVADSTRLWPILGARNIFQVGTNLILKDDTVEVLNENITHDYKDGDSLAPIINDITKQAQALIDKYIAEKKLNAKNAYSNAIDSITENLDLTE